MTRDHSQVTWLLILACACYGTGIALLCALIATWPRNKKRR